MNRRNFLKTSMAVAAATTISGAGKAMACSSLTGIVYSSSNQGKWQGKAGSHAPQVKVSGSSVEVTTKHGMAQKHYIVRQTLIGADGTVLGEKTFTPADKPTATFTLPAGYKGHITATSFCNLHDLWITEAKV
ncbi:MAG: desulfoferrodoxin family protein [Thermodesulfobacteriota bacterium]